MNFELIFIEFFNIFCPFESIEWQIFKSNQMNENAEYAIHVQSNFDLLNSTLTKIKERDPLTA